MASPPKQTPPGGKSHGFLRPTSTVTAASSPQPEGEQPQSPTKPAANVAASPTPSCDSPPGAQEAAATATAAVKGSDGGATPGPPPELQPVQDCGRLLNRLSQSLLASMLDVPSRVQWNLLMSPISLATALASLVAGCEGPTKEDLCNVLRLTLPEVEAIVERFKTEAAEHMFYVANRMFLQSNCPLLATFRSHIEAKYMTTAQNVDFESPEQSYVRAINEWCSNATNGKVPAVVTRKTFAASSSMVLVSAVYFKGLWKDKFYPNATHMMKFHVSRADTLDVRMMTRTGRFPYAEVPSLRIRALEVPYRTEKLTMVLILPTEVDGLRLTQQSLLAGDTLWEVTRKLRPRANVRLGLPKFVLTARNKMRDLLEGIGSHRPFDPEQAQFINISGFKGLHTTEIIQAVTVEVSEDGNEITRTSALVNEVVAKMAPTTQFLVDRPFLFFVRSKATGAILLFGCVRQPLEWRPDSPDNSALL
ncbi:leukocyte elastase inhibitor-like [Dermacentor albipictus]|uniref:leukocyte elastase inhibitor-like n=1 Tax=Dermacentor albipictus TaxID=60249 RepID=UPI0038FC2F5D